MKKNIITITLIIISSWVYSQNNIAGYYTYGTGHSYFMLDLKSDSTFIFEEMKTYPDIKGTWTYTDSIITLIASGDSSCYFPVFEDTSVKYSKEIQFRLIDSLSIYPGNQVPKQKLDTIFILKNDVIIDTVYDSVNLPGPFSLIGYYTKKLEYNKEGIVIKTYNDNYVYFAYETGVPKKFTEYKNNQKNGIEINYYPNGVVESYGYWRKGRKRNKWKYFYKSSRKMRM